MKVLITAAQEDAATMLSSFNEESIELFHTPLERYVTARRSAYRKELKNTIAEAENIIFGNYRNARLFLDWIGESELLEEVRERVSMVLDESTAELLEAHGIPAIRPAAPNAIGLMELMLRLRRLGPVLYPTGTGINEEMPGLLTELDLPVDEFEFYETTGPLSEELEQYRKQLAGQLPETVVFHSRSSVTRTITAYPDLDLRKTKNISASPGVTLKLKESVPGATITAEAEETWKSIAETIVKVAET